MIVVGDTLSYERSCNGWGTGMSRSARVPVDAKDQALSGVAHSWWVQLTVEPDRLAPPLYGMV